MRKIKNIGLVTAFLITLALCLISLNREKVYAEGSWQGDFYIDNGLLTKYSGMGGAIVIPDTVTDIAQEVFLGNSRVTSVVIPASVKTIGSYAFACCDNLASVEFKVDINGRSKISLISKGCFQECDSLSKVYLPEGIATIGYGAFEYCHYLSKVYIPKSVSAVKDYAFHGTSLSTVYFGGTEYQWDSIAKGYCAFRSIDGEFYGGLYYNATRTSFDDESGYSYNYDERPGAIYWDYEETQPVGEIVIWMNGNKTKEDGQTINKSEAVVYTDVLASYILLGGSGSDAKVGTGKVVAGITTSSDVPGQSQLEQKNGPAQVKIKSGKITIKAKSSPGDYYLHVLDTGDKKKHAYCKLKIEAAPSSVEVVDDTGKSFKKNTFTMIVGDAYCIRVKPIYKSPKGEAVADADHIEYTIGGKTPALYEGDWGGDYYYDNGTWKLEHTGEEAHSLGWFWIRALGLNENNTQATITFTDAFSRKKSTLKLKTINPVNGIKMQPYYSSVVMNPGTDTKTFEADTPNFTIKAEYDNKGRVEKAEYKLNVYLDFMSDMYQTKVGSNYTWVLHDHTENESWDHEYPTTDKGKIYQIGNPKFIDVDTLIYKNKIKSNEKPTKEQKMITAKLNKDKRSINVTVKKNAVVGTTAWFVLFFNNGLENYNDEDIVPDSYPNMDHIGFMVFSITLT